MFVVYAAYDMWTFGGFDSPKAMSSIISIVILFLLIPATYILKEIMFQRIADFHKRFGVNPTARENKVYVVAMTAQLLCQPRNLYALPCHLLPDERTDM